MKMRTWRQTSGGDERPADVGSEAGNKVPDQPDSGQRNSLIAIAAYYLAERRGFEPGHEIEDWLEAEAQVEAMSRMVSLPCAQSFWSE